MLNGASGFFSRLAFTQKLEKCFLLLRPLCYSPVELRPLPLNEHFLELVEVVRGIGTERERPSSSAAQTKRAPPTDVTEQVPPNDETGRDKARPSVNGGPRSVVAADVAYEANSGKEGKNKKLLAPLGGRERACVSKPR